MISHDRLAQFWEGFGHISYYQRVDLDALINYKSDRARTVPTFDHRFGEWAMHIAQQDEHEV